MQSPYIPVIGLEIHVQLNTKSKIFASDHTVFGAPPNTQISALTIAHPGTLPVVNKQAISYAVQLGLALNCEIDREVYFDRKNYFYPDLPKGYQITQDARPICKGGGLEVVLKSGEIRFIPLTKIHMEEDAGKSVHMPGEKVSHVDLNRAGMPLLEIVTEPALGSSEEAAQFVTEIRKLVRYLGICDGNMEQGSLRCDANISIHLPGEPLGQKVEVKNMNSVRNVAKAIDHEIHRQQKLISKGEEILSETRTFNPDTGHTSSMRSKETLNDYRYFPEPDISPVWIDEEWFESLRAAIPMLPNEVKSKLMEQYQLPEYDAAVISEDRDFANYFFDCANHTHDWKMLSNWMKRQIKSWLNEQDLSISLFPISGKRMAEMLNQINAGVISQTAAQQVFDYLILHPQMDVSKAIQDLNLAQENNSDVLEEMIASVLEEMPDKVMEYHRGKKGLTALFMGQVMKKTGGKADPKLTSQMLIKMLDDLKN